MKLVSLPYDKFDEYKLNVIFKGYKWDPQFLDNCTVARHVLVLSKHEAAELQQLTDKLCEETINAENTLLSDLKLARPLRLRKKSLKLLKKTDNYSFEKHIRLMRFDFHPIMGGGWAVSEVNSDVPGGFAEASLMPMIAAEMLEDKSLSYINFGEGLADAFSQRVKKNGRIALIHCTSYSDDRQVMQFMGDSLKRRGFEVIYAAADHLNFKNRRAVSILDGRKGEVDGILRFTPLEWFFGLPKAWRGYYHTITPSCNHPIAVFAQTKRFPFVWEGLERAGVDLSAWRRLLPKTYEVKHAKSKDSASNGIKEDIIFKPAYGRVGEGILIKNAISKEECGKIQKDVKKHPRRYVAQEMFKSLPLTTDEGEYHVCLGCYSIDRKAAGFYARISKTTRIDSGAADIPVLIEDI